ncbi:MAG: hypothetical protein ACRCZE_03410 [Candidatus Altimarinota bacterium]
MKKQKNPQQSSLPEAEVKSVEKVKKTPFWLKLLFVVLTLLVLLNTFQLWNFNRVIGGLDQYSGGVVDEIGGLQGDLKQFGADLNEIRRFLLLPEREYSFDQKTVEQLPDDQKNSSENELAIYKFLQNLEDEKKLNEQKSLAVKQRDEVMVESMLSENGLGVGEASDDAENLFLKILNNENSQPLFNIIWDFKNGNLQVQSVLESKEIAKLTDANWKDILNKYLLEKKSLAIEKKSQLDVKTAEILALRNDAELANLLESKGMVINEMVSDQGDKLMLMVDSIGSGSMMYILLDKTDYSYTLDRNVSDGKLEGVKLKSLEELKKALIEGVNGFVLPEVQMLEDKKAELKDIFEQEAFQELLKAQNLKLADKPREEQNKILYDVTNADGTVSFSFAIELSSGMFKVVQGDQEVDLLNFLIENDEGSKKKP